VQLQAPPPYQHRADLVERVDPCFLLLLPPSLLVEPALYSLCLYTTWMEQQQQEQLLLPALLLPDR
jgi:hypothetical protein